MVKPLAEGSSFGVLIVKEDQPHPPQELTWEDWPYGEEVLVERYVAGRELTCAVIGGKAYDVIEIKASDGGWYDYNAKYAAGGRFTNFRQILKKIFTTLCKSRRSRRTRRLDAAV